MSPRRLQIMTLLARQGRGQLGRTAAELAETRNREMQQFDLADRIERMIAQTAHPKGEALSRGELSTAYFMGTTLAQQLQDTRAQMSETQAQSASLKQDLGQQVHRQQVLTERADETRRALIRDRDKES